MLSLMSLAQRLIETGIRVERRLHEVRAAYQGEEELWQAQLTLARLVSREGDRLMAGVLLWMRHGGLAQVNFESQRMTIRERTTDGVRVITRRRPSLFDFLPIAVRMMNGGHCLQQKLWAQEMQARLPGQRRPA
jgi:hypothetical protein